MANNTHYNNLKVARDASSDVIRAAYKELTQQYASDQNPSVDASKLMKIIHNSYSILSNPVQKIKYDQWLVEQESENAVLKKTGTGNQSGHAVGSRSNIYELKRVEDIKPDSVAGDGDNILELTLVAGNEIANIPDKKDIKRNGWLLYGAIGLAALITTGWFGFFGGATKNDINQTPVNADTGKLASMTSQTALTGNTLPIQNSEDMLNTPDMRTASIPIHDQVAIGKFIGQWKGVNDVSAVQQTLDISLKSDHSLVFRLDSKAGQSIGGLYGIAEFENGYARFFNKEYGCSIVFSIKSDVLNVAETGCQPFYRNGAVFDGSYMRPELMKASLKPAPALAKSAVLTPVESIASQSQPQTAQPTTPKSVSKLHKYMVTVKNSDGGVTMIELVAKDKESARKIIRDYRGDPEIIKIKELKK